MRLQKKSLRKSTDINLLMIDPSSIFTEEGLEEVLSRLVSRYIMNEYCLKNKVKFLDRS